MKVTQNATALEVVESTRSTVQTKLSFTAAERRMAVLTTAMPVLTVTAWHTPVRPATMVAVTCVGLWLLTAQHRRAGSIFTPVRPAPGGMALLVAGLVLLVTSYFVAWSVTSTPVILVCAATAAGGTAALCRFPVQRSAGAARAATAQERAQAHSGVLDPALTEPGTLAVATVLDFFVWVPGSVPAATLDLTEEAVADHLTVLARAGHVRLDGRATRGLAKVRLRLTASGRSAYRSHVAALRRELPGTV